jgi:hypothetical protein
LKDILAHLKVASLEFEPRRAKVKANNNFSLKSQLKDYAGKEEIP